MDITGYLRFEFDEDSRILYLRGARFVGITTEERLNAVMEAIRTEMRRRSGPGRMYMIIDVTNLVIPPELSQSYGRLAADIYNTYAFPGGVARFGHQITRLAVRRGYMDYMDDDPHIYGTRAEAEAYIRSLIARRQAKAESSTSAAVTPEYSSND
jgi:hypothetical protein